MPVELWVCLMVLLMLVVLLVLYLLFLLHRLQDTTEPANHKPPSNTNRSNAPPHTGAGITAPEPGSSNLARLEGGRSGHGANGGATPCTQRRR